MTPLEELTDEEFVSELSSAIHENDWFADFMERHLQDRTRAALVEMKQSIASQLAIHEDDDSGWRVRAINKVRKIDHRLAQVKAVRRGNASREEELRNDWGKFAFAIASALEISNMNPMLDQIHLGSMSARDFLQAKKRAVPDFAGDLFREPEDG